jgi:hypothetical protein
VSPILVRPVREQLEHDRVIRLLYAKYRRRYDVAMNPGAEQNAAVGAGAEAAYPDLVLSSQERGHRLRGVVEVKPGRENSPVLYVRGPRHSLEWLRQYAGKLMRADEVDYKPNGDLRLWWD